MKLQARITLTLLTVSLITAACVGVVAYGYLMRNFQKSSEDKAFEHFTSDITAYIDQYGSLVNGQQHEPFILFLNRLKAKSGGHFRNAETGGNPAPREMAPFRFLILDPNGYVIDGTESYSPGQQVPDDVLAKSRPIESNGEVVLRVVQIGDVVLSSQDWYYLTSIRKALIIGFLTAGIISVLLGFLLGKQQGAALRELSTAIDAMSLDGETQQEVPVRSRDEIGILARAFNRMSKNLSRTHAELKASHDRIQAQARELKELSVRDPLTGLFNRRHFDAQAEILYNQSLRYQRPLAVMIGDLDHFKRINDRISHNVGDDVLREVAGIILSNTRKSDIAARYGGEEFVIAFTESTLANARQLCEKLRGLIESHPWDNIHPDLNVTISMGICDNITLGSIEKMLNEADRQLYKAKNLGRNCVMPAVVAGPELN
jgi:diguanylate cyclase (GGDEF)-like protein